MSLPTRILGKTGVEVSVLGLGSGAFGFDKVSHETGVAIVRRALELGVTYFDSAHYYESESMVGDGLLGARDSVFVATKTTKRNREGAHSDLRLSLKQLRTDRIDLVSLHCVNTVSDVEAALGRGGALEALIEAKRQGEIRFVGITGHARPNVLAFAIERFPFDVVMAAMGAIDALVTGPQHFLIPQVKRLGTGLVAMKVIGNRALVSHEDLAIRFSLGLGADTAVVGVESVAEVEAAAAASESVSPLSTEELETLMTTARARVIDRTGWPEWLGDSQIIAFQAEWVGAVAPQS